MRYPALSGCAILAFCPLYSIREEYIIEDGIRTKRVVRDIFFMSDEQIRLARRFVSGFIYETSVVNKPVSQSSAEAF